MIIHQSSIFNARPEQVWREIQSTRLLHYVSSPLLTFTPVDGKSLPEVWQQGKYAVKMKLFGILPLGEQFIDIAQPSQEECNGHRYAMLDNGYGQLISKWRHFITIDDEGEGTTKYTDLVEVQAGLFTFMVWVFASIFFWHRQRRWKKLIQNGFNYQ